MTSALGAWVALTLSAAAPAGGDVAAAALPVLGRIQLSVGVPRVVLGVTTQVPVEARVVDEAGLPVDADPPPSLECSTGRAGVLTRVDTGVYQGRWLPPPERHPHVALLLAHAAVSGQRVAGFLPVPLWGRGQLRVDTKPLSTVTLVLGETVVGPVQADRRGVAMLDVESPPGPTRATAESVDRAGNESRKPVDLGVPPFNRLAAFAPWPGAAGGVGTVLLAASSARGTPRGEAGFTLTAQGAPADEASLIPVATGLWAWDVPMPHAPGTAVLASAQLPDAQSRAAVELRVVAGPPAMARVTVGGRGAERVVSAEVRDAVSNSAPLDGVTLFNVAAGKPLVARAVAPGVLAAPAPGGPGAAPVVLEVRHHARTLAVLTLPAQPAPPPLAAAASAGTLEAGEATRAGLPWPQRAVAVAVRVPHQDGSSHAPGPLDVTAPDGVQVLGRRDTPTHTVLVLLPAPVRQRDRTQVVIQSPDGMTTLVSIPTVRLPVLERWAQVQGRTRAHVGGLLLAGVGVDAGFSWPLPLDTAPYRLALRFGASASTEWAAPLSSRLPPVSLTRVAWGSPAMGFAGVEGGYGPWRVHADAGLGAWAVQVRLKAASQSPAALLGVGSLVNAGTGAALGGVAPMLGARVGGAWRWRFVQLGAEALVDGGWLFTGGGVSGPAGGLTLAGGAGLLF